MLLEKASVSPCERNFIEIMHMSIQLPRRIADTFFDFEQ